jgi:hypothetical protein
VRSQQTEWQPLIGGRGAANQKGAPHVRARSFNHRVEGRADPECWHRGVGLASTGRRSSRPELCGDWVTRGFLRLQPIAGEDFLEDFPALGCSSVLKYAVAVGAGRPCSSPAAMRLRKACLLFLLLAMAQLLVAANAGGADEGIRASGRAGAG